MRETGATQVTRRRPCSRSLRAAFGRVVHCDRAALLRAARRCRRPFCATSYRNRPSTSSNTVETCSERLPEPGPTTRSAWAGIS